MYIKVDLVKKTRPETYALQNATVNTLVTVPHNKWLTHILVRQYHASTGHE